MLKHRGAPSFGRPQRDKETKNIRSSHGPKIRGTNSVRFTRASGSKSRPGLCGILAGHGGGNWQTERARAAAVLALDLPRQNTPLSSARGGDGDDPGKFPFLGGGEMLALRRWVLVRAMRKGRRGIRVGAEFLCATPPPSGPKGPLTTSG